MSFVGTTDRTPWGSFDMSGLQDLLGSALGGNTLGSLAAQLGTDESKAKDAVSTALPALLGRLQSNASTPEGAESLHKALGQHDGSVLDDVQGFLGKGDHDGSQDRMLGKVFGSDRDSEINALAGKAGLDPSMMAKLMGALGPLVLGALTKSGAASGGAGGLGSMLGGLLGGSGGGSGGGLGDLLGSVMGNAAGGGGASHLSGATGAVGSGAAGAGGAASGGLGKMANMLDRDGDGNPMNDVQQMAKSGIVQKLLGFLKKR